MFTLYAVGYNWKFNCIVSQKCLNESAINIFIYLRFTQIVQWSNKLVYPHWKFVSPWIIYMFSFSFLPEYVWFKRNLDLSEIRSQIDLCQITKRKTSRRAKLRVRRISFFSEWGIYDTLWRIILGSSAGILGRENSLTRREGRSKVNSVKRLNVKHQRYHRVKRIRLL